MKNFPHQFNNLEKLQNALRLANDLIKKNLPLNDEVFGEALTRDEIYTYRDRNLSIEEYLRAERRKPRQNRGYMTVSRDIRRLLQLLDLIDVSEPDKLASLTKHGLELINAHDNDEVNLILKERFFKLALVDSDGKLSHPYQILIRLVRTFPGIDTSKLMLALEAVDDTDEEFDRISELSDLTFNEILDTVEVSPSMARNAVKILPGIAEQLGDISRQNDKAYPTKFAIVSEDEITTERDTPKTEGSIIYRKTNIDEIAKDPSLKDVSNMHIDLTSAIKIRQLRLKEHQEIVRLIAKMCEENDFDLFEGNFDCFATKKDKGLLFEIKTISTEKWDFENQTLKAVGQLKFYNYLILKKNNFGINEIEQILVFSQKPHDYIIEFCMKEKILSIWFEGDRFYYKDDQGDVILFDLSNY